MNETLNYVGSSHFESNKNMSSSKLRDLLDQYDYFATCKVCKLQIQFTFVNQLIVHYIECSSFSNQPNEKVVIIEPDQNDNLRQVFDQNNSLLMQEINHTNVVQSILNVGNLSVSSKAQYQSALMKLLKTIESKDLNKLCGFDLLKIMQDQCTNLTQVNAVIRLQNIMNIQKSVEFKQKVKLQKKLIKEHVEKRPHRSWDLNYIQELLNELFVCNRGFLAFRLFILYELAARISELAQITFQMVVNGFINYKPKKQKRLGKNAERRFQITMSVQLQTKEFVKRNSLNLFQTIDIGLHKQTIKSQSVHKQLKYALKFIENGKVNHSNEYKEFLQIFQYHDLRYTKLQEMNKSGIYEKIIQLFVKHSNTKTTKLYLQNQNINEIINLNTISQQQSKEQLYVSPNLVLNFQDENDLY